MKYALLILLLLVAWVVLNGSTIDLLIVNYGSWEDSAQAAWVAENMRFSVSGPGTDYDIAKRQDGGLLWFIYKSAGETTPDSLPSGDSENAELGRFLGVRANACDSPSVMWEKMFFHWWDSTHYWPENLEATGNTDDVLDQGDWVNPENSVTSNNQYATEATTDQDIMRLFDVSVSIGDSGRPNVDSLMIIIEGRAESATDIEVAWGVSGYTPSSPWYTISLGTSDTWDTVYIADWDSLPSESEIEGDSMSILIKDDAADADSILIDYAHIRLQYVCVAPGLENSQNAADTADSRIPTYYQSRIRMMVNLWDDSLIQWYTEFICSTVTHSSDGADSLPNGIFWDNGNMWPPNSPTKTGDIKLGGHVAEHSDTGFCDDVFDQYETYDYWDGGTMGGGLRHLYVRVASCFDTLDGYKQQMINGTVTNLSYITDMWLGDSLGNIMVSNEFHPDWAEGEATWGYFFHACTVFADDVSDGKAKWTIVFAGNLVDTTAIPYMTYEKGKMVNLAMYYMVAESTTAMFHYGYGANYSQPNNPTVDQGELDQGYPAVWEEGVYSPAFSKDIGSAAARGWTSIESSTDGNSNAYDIYQRVYDSCHVFVRFRGTGSQVKDSTSAITLDHDSTWYVLQNDGEWNETSQDTFVFYNGDGYIAKYAGTYYTVLTCTLYVLGNNGLYVSDADVTPADNYNDTTWIDSTASLGYVAGQCTTFWEGDVDPDSTFTPFFVNVRKGDDYASKSFTPTVDDLTDTISLDVTGDVGGAPVRKRVMWWK